MSPTMRLIALFGCLLMTGCSAVNYSLPSNQIVDAPIQPEQAGVRTAEDIGERIIRLAKNLNKIDDISPESIERHTGLEVKFNENNRLIYGFHGLISEPWIYVLTSAQESEGSTPRQLIFSFSDQGQAEKANKAAICKPTFQDYRNALTEAGYTFKRVPVAPKWIGLRLSRGSVHITLAPQRRTDPDDPLACLHSMRMFIQDDQQNRPVKPSL